MVCVFSSLWLLTLSTNRLYSVICILIFFFSSRRRHTRCALVTGIQTCALPICRGPRPKPEDPHLPIDPEAAAEQSGLHYVSDDMPGTRRRRAGKSFS